MKRSGSAASDEQQDSDGPDQPNILGAFIRAQRERADLSLRQLSGMTTISNAYLSQIERGLHEPSIRVLKSVADALGLSTEALLVKAGLITERVDGDDEHAQPTTEQSIMADPLLGPEEKQALLGVYRSYVAGRA
ncbi:MAG: helix-turn-helix domain-containing protein [Acidimicrobiales bacterium]